MFTEFFMGNKEERAVFQARDQLRSQSILSSRSRQRLEGLEGLARPISRRLFLRRVGAAGVVLVTSGVATALLLSERQQTTDLDLKIDEAGFWNAVNAGPRMGIITQTEDRKKMDHLQSLGNLWISESSPSFKVAINKPMADFMFTQADLTNPALPTRILLWENWLPKTEKEHTGGYAAVADDGSDQIIVVSLKVAALEAFLGLDRQNLAPADYFDGAVSYVVSRYMAHEMAHAGRQTKRLLKKGEFLMSESLADATHPQIFAFDEKYTQLYSQALLKGSGEAALIFGVSLETGVDLQTYKTQLLQEARSRGMIE